MATLSASVTTSSAMTPTGTPLPAAATLADTPTATPADELLIAARKHCRDPAAYEKLAAEYACGFCGILRPEVRVAHACEHAICEPCAAECVRIRKACRCGEPYWLCDTPDFSALVATPLPFSSPTSLSSAPSASPPHFAPTVRSMYTRSSPAAARALRHLVFSCPNACHQPTGLAFADLVRHCTGDACTNAAVACSECGQRMRPSEKDAHARECPGRLVKCAACGTSNIRQDALHVHDAFLCPAVAVCCPIRDCGVELRRENLAAHLADDCPHQETPCVMARFGCGFSGQRRFLNRHLVDGAAQHLGWALRSHADLERRFEALSDKVSSPPLPPPSKTSPETDGLASGDLGVLRLAVVAAADPDKPAAESKTPIPLDVAPSVPSVVSASCAPVPACAIDLPVSEMKRRLDGLMLRAPSDRPAVLAADRRDEWYVASIAANPAPESSATSVTVRFAGFEGADETLDLASGRVRPLFATPTDHAAFLDGLRANDVVDCRISDPLTWAWTPCVVLWRDATEIGVRQRGGVGDGARRVHIIRTPHSRCLPLGVASQLALYSLDAFPPYTA